ncbi:MAG: RraA family protein, partial [Gemmatimonadetes bacterium]|nr:RraA family protein [Gemmatimonadota bacterium]
MASGSAVGLRGRASGVFSPRAVVTTAEVINLRDIFGKERLSTGTYTPGQIDTRWIDEIEADFSRWLED